ncbi:MAG: YciI family protein [Pseudonocardiaceae bacterium]
MLAVIRYDVQAEQAGRLQEVYPQHRAYLDLFAKGGDLLLIGTLENPVKNGSLAVFRSKDAAERFVHADPFVLEGLVEPHVLEWNALEFLDLSTTG